MSRKGECGGVLNFLFMYSSCMYRGGSLKVMLKTCLYSRSDCPSCTGPTTNNHVRDLTDDLEVTPVKLTTPPNHWIINITKAIQNQDTNELEIIKDLYLRHMRASTDKIFAQQLHGDKTILLQCRKVPCQLQQTYPPSQPLDRLSSRIKTTIPHCRKDP